MANSRQRRGARRKRERESRSTELSTTVEDLSPSLSILSELMAKSPAFAKFVAKRAAAARPLLRTGDNYPEPEMGDAVWAHQNLPALLSKPPSLGAYAEKHVPAALPRQKARNWQIPFGPVYGQAGTTTTLRTQPSVLFRGEKIIATDTWSPPGTGTKIANIFVGAKSQRPGGAGPSLTTFFGSNTLGSGVKMDTCMAAMAIAVTVEFIHACTFDMSIFGRAVV